MKFFMVIDGPNIISRLIDIGIKKEIIVHQLSINKLYNDEIKRILRIEFSTITCLGLEFICSEKSPGPQKKKLSKEEFNILTERLSFENSVYLNKISISSNNEKGVDVAVAMRMIEVSETCDIICLVSSDKDYIPALEFLRKKGKYIVTAGIKEKHPKEIINLSYLFIDLTEYFTKFFPGTRPTAYSVSI